jgi:hypothetical protein
LAPRRNSFNDIEKFKPKPENKPKKQNPRYKPGGSQQEDNESLKLKIVKATRACIDVESL